MGRALRRHAAIKDDVAVAVRATLSKYVTPRGVMMPAGYGSFRPATIEPFRLKMTSAAAVYVAVQASQLTKNLARSSIDGGIDSAARSNWKERSF